MEEQAHIPEKEKAHMRSPKLTSAIMAAAALLVLAAAGPAAARARAHTPKAHRNAPTGKHCRITLSVAPRLLTAGETALASGQTTCSPPEGQKVVIYQRPAAGPPSGYSVAGEAVTTKGGLYEAKVGPLNANTQFYAAVNGVSSDHRQVKVAPQVSFEGPPENRSLFTGLAAAKTNLFSGTVNPKEAGLLVVLQREDAVRGTEWHRIAATTTDAQGNYAFTKRFLVAGASSLRIVVRSNHRLVAGFSTVRSYDISQAQNPSLLIISTTNPIALAGTTVIEGNAPGLPNTMLTLQGHPAHQKFANVATTTTDSTGHYSFAPQAPALSTFYRVTGPGRTSAVLYQGVKYVLTATPSATSVTSGQPITFTGTVSPARAGHEIWIEKQNIFGTGFHPVAVGSVNADGSYSITRAFFAPGSDVLRVKIPGDPENGGTASAPVTVTVTPVPGAKVPAERPGNGTLPSEGQTK
ncbi:MAG TPA: hypothetical protein VGD00_08180 [Solirubrobacteraceae bacterium]